jgi:uncharacterized protein with ParB-like and HNH nuclease domain
METWDMKRTLYKISDFISWQRAGTLDLSPSFQRRPVWKSGAKSFFIDTIARGLPVPIIFLREKKTDLHSLEPKREIVDGQQRIRTIFSYIDPTLLKDFNPKQDSFDILKEHNEDLAGINFNNLPLKIRQHILDYDFSVHVLPAGIDDKEILQIFARMNSTGLRLTPQELRNADNFGKFKTSMYKIAAEQLNRWRNWKIFSEYNLARMEEVELTSEFALLMLKGLSGKNQKSIDNIYKTKDEKYPEQNMIEKRFRIVMDTIDDKLGKKMPNLPFSKKTLFYHLFAFLYDLQFGIDSKLKRTSAKTVSNSIIRQLIDIGQHIEQQSAPNVVVEAVARRTTNLKSRKAILDYFRKTIKNA